MSRELRLMVVECARAMASQGLVVGTVGNVSARDGEEVVVTPTEMAYTRMVPGDLVAVGLEGQRLAGSREPSRELPLHLAVYRRHPEVGALVHTHSPHATAWSFLGEPLLPETEENRYYGVGEVLTTPVAPAGSIELAEAATIALGDSRAVLLGCHGVLAAGRDPWHALEVAAAVEHQAEVAFLLKLAA